MNIEILRRQSTYSLKAMIKALSQPISSFLNTDEDNERLENAKKVLKERKKKATFQWSGEYDALGHKIPEIKYE